MNTSTASPTVPVLEAPTSGAAQLVSNTLSYSNALTRLSTGSGPFAVDAERASGYRYGNRNYLIQIKREGAGIFLIDPIAIDDLSELNAVMQEDTWIFHAATQDLNPLANQGLIPQRIFDTEYAARLLGLERVNLAAVSTHYLGLSLAKEFSHQDWSVRPLPEAWLNYAALDVEVLAEIAHAEVKELKAQGKFEWALEEFEYLRTLPATPKPEPWRRTSGIQTIHDRRKLAIVREVWLEREKIARTKDTSPSRILPDRAIIQAANSMPRTPGALLSLHDFGGAANRRRAHQWQRAIQRALALDTDKLPLVRVPSPPRAPALKFWEDKSPLAAQRFEPAKQLVDDLAVKHTLPVEHVLQPKVLRQLVWDSVEGPIDVARFLRESGAREWQIQLVSPALQDILTQH